MSNVKSVLSGGKRMSFDVFYRLYLQTLLYYTDTIL